MVSPTLTRLFAVPIVLTALMSAPAAAAGADPANPVVGGAAPTADGAAAPVAGAAAPVPDPGAAAPPETASAASLATADGQAGDPVADACRQFGVALNVAAANYEEFAYATAGNGNNVDYQDPNVLRTNVVGRTALRESAATALAAAQTPGLPPEVADPMTAWSLRATKLLVVMGLHGGGDSLNSSATELNSDAHDAQMACAAHGGHG